MKELLIFVFLLFGQTLNAQGKWSVVETVADELKGIKGGYHYKYSAEGMGEIEIYDLNDWQFRLGTYDGGFDFNEIKSGQVYNYTMGGGLGTQTVTYAKPRFSNIILMGRYDKNNKLKDKLELSMEVDHNQKCQNLSVNKTWFGYPQTGRKVKKMIKAMYYGDGYVRIVAKRTGMPDFDLKITPYNLNK